MVERKDSIKWAALGLKSWAISLDMDSRLRQRITPCEERTRRNFLYIPNEPATAGEEGSLLAECSDFKSKAF